MGELYTHLCGEGARERYIEWEKHPQYTQPGSNHDLPVIGNLVYFDSSALDHVAIKANQWCIQEKRRGVEGANEESATASLQQRERGKPFRKNHSHYTQPVSNPEHPVLGSLVFCDTNTFDRATTKVIGGVCNERASWCSFGCQGGGHLSTEPFLPSGILSNH
uniref:Uncharacterized protein n=1 Tax=Timema douglasi TaxID=61478 RepID=A0A7R8VV60_TIMDO|nr:unnamed protein product [Timema douglasi]